MNENDQIVGVDDKHLGASASSLPKLPNLRSGDPDRFAQAVRALVESRAQAGWPRETPDANVGGFVMVPRPRELKECFNSEPVTDLAATEDPIMGRVMLLTRDGSRGQAFPMPCTANELPDWLVDHRLGEAPLVLVYRKTLKMSIRLRGADGDLSRTDQIRDTPPSATLQE